MTFEAGRSGNPGGRPKEDPKLRNAAREHTDAALGVLVAALDDENTKNRITAAQAILDRGYGKPTQPIAGDDEAAPINVLAKIERVIVNAQN